MNIDVTVKAFTMKLLARLETQSQVPALEVIAK